MALVKRFILAQRLYSENAKEAARQRELLLDEPDLDGAIHSSDVLGFLEEHHLQAQEFQMASRYLEETWEKNPCMNLNYYVSQQIVEAVHRGLGIPLSRNPAPQRIHHISIENKGVEDKVADEVEFSQGA